MSRMTTTAAEATVALDLAIARLVELHAQHLGPIRPRASIVAVLANVLEEDLQQRTDLDDAQVVAIVAQARAIADNVLDQLD